MEIKEEGEIKNIAITNISFIIFVVDKQSTLINIIYCR